MTVQNFGPRLLPEGAMKRTIFIALLLLTAAACNDSAQREAAEEWRRAYAARAIDDERGRINGLSIGSSEAAVVAAFGPPERIEEGFSEVVTKPSKVLFYDGIKLYLVGDEIYNLKCRSTRCVTHDGITPGDSTNKILAIFGKGKPVERDDGTKVLGYPLAGTEGKLVFRLQDNKVVELELWFDYT